MKNEQDVKMLKIDVFNFEDSLFDNESIIVECILKLESEYIIKAMIDNDCINYSFIDIDIAQQICEALEISLLKLNKLREVKNYDEKRNKDIIHAIYSFMIIQNHTENWISMMIIKLDQHSIILNKFWIKKHDINYHDHDDLISFYFDHCDHLKAFNHSYSNRSNRIQTKKKDFFSKEIFSDQSKIIENKEIKFFLEKTNNSKMILKKKTSVEFNKKLNERFDKLNEHSERLIERRMNESWKEKAKKDWNFIIENFEKRIKDKFLLWRNFIEISREINKWRKHYWNSFNSSRFVQYFVSSEKCENLRRFHEEFKNSTQKAR